MGWIFGQGTAGMLYAGGLLLLVMYVYLWFTNPRMAIDATQSIGRMLAFIFTIVFKILYAIAKWIGQLAMALFGGRKR